MELQDIKSPADIKGLSYSELEHIASQMREAVLNRTSQIGGHVGPNLGAVETIIGMHYVFDAPIDRLVYDVSHQAFPHKMLTGRVDGYLYREDFPKVGEYTSPVESPEYDIFWAGHTSPALSLCVGLAKARELKGENYNIVALVGDGALSGGEAFEGLDAGGALDSNLICIINDNQMSIAEDHGGIYKHLQHLRETNGTATDNLFKAFNWEYVYVAEGNNVAKVIEALKQVKNSKKPTIVHINTQKGEGYTPAEEYREAFHYRDPYDIATGDLLIVKEGPNSTTVLKDFINRSAEKYPTFLAISSATPDSFGLNAKERELLGSHYIDVGIAEQTGVAVMAGAARDGAKAVYSVVGTFLQRAYDQLVEDWAMDPSPALMVVAETGIAANKDQTHLGFWDIPMITSIPDIIYLAPANLEEFDAMLEWGLSQDKYKVAVRQPVYTVEHADYEVDKDYSDLNKFKIIKEGKEVALIGAGDFLIKARQVADLLAQKGIDATIVNPRFVSGIDKEMLENLSKSHKLIVTLEDGSIEGGFGQRLASAMGLSNVKVINLGVEKKFVDRFKLKELEAANNLLPQQIVDLIMANL